MSLYAHGDRRFRILRATPNIVDAGAAAASMTIARQPIRESLVEAIVAGGTAGSGSITLVGTVGGTAGMDETLTFSGNGIQRSTQAFTALSAVTTAGLTSEVAVPTVTLRAVGRDGGPQHQETQVADDRAGTLWTPFQSRWGEGVGGSMQMADVKIALPYEEVWTPREGDIFVDLISSERWRVVGVPTQKGAMRGRFWEIGAQRFQDAP
jgi:hypothetical protein